MDPFCGSARFERGICPAIHSLENGGIFRILAAGFADASVFRQSRRRRDAPTRFDRPGSIEKPAFRTGGSHWSGIVRPSPDSRPILSAPTQFRKADAPARRCARTTVDHQRVARPKIDAPNRPTPWLADQPIPRPRQKTPAASERGLLPVLEKRGQIPETSISMCRRLSQVAVRSIRLSPRRHISSRKQGFPLILLAEDPSAIDRQAGDAVLGATRSPRPRRATKPKERGEFRIGKQSDP